jgi:hypothetical protein
MDSPVGLANADEPSDPISANQNGTSADSVSAATVASMPVSANTANSHILVQEGPPDQTASTSDIHLVQQESSGQGDSHSAALNIYVTIGGNGNVIIGNNGVFNNQVTRKWNRSGKRNGKGNRKWNGKGNRKWNGKGNRKWNGQGNRKWIGKGTGSEPIKAQYFI